MQLSDTVKSLPAAVNILHSETVPTPGADPSVPVGTVEPCAPNATNEHVFVRVPNANRAHAVRGRFVKIVDKLRGTRFLGQVIAGPFFPDGADGDVLIKVEIEGELTGRGTTDTHDRPAAGSPVRALTAERVGELLGCAGNMRFGTLAGWEAVPVALPSQSKDLLPRNVGIFGTVGSGKSNTAQVLIEEAAAGGWAVVVIDVEGEYIDMDEPVDRPELEPALARHGRKPHGIEDFYVIHPASCASERVDSRPFTLRLADFDTPVVTELIQATKPERNALMDCVEHFQMKVRTKAPTTEADFLAALIDPSPHSPRLFTLQQLYDRARDRSSKTSDLFDYLGLATKLLWLINSGAFDQPNMPSLDPVGMLTPGRVTIVDVSVANDTVKNLAMADLLRKVFADKVLRSDAPPTLVVVEEAHSFVSREKAPAMQATLEMLRSVTRRGRKRWLATAFVSQQPGHLPPEIFELCNTRIVHNLRSMHNLDALMATTGDIAGELWARCPLLGTGEAIVSSPQLNRPTVVSMRPAASRRKFSQ
jgi:uncharacterized protein